MPGRGALGHRHLGRPRADRLAVRAGVRPEPRQPVAAPPQLRPRARGLPRAHLAPGRPGAGRRALAGARGRDRARRRRSSDDCRRDPAGARRGARPAHACSPRSRLATGRSSSTTAPPTGRPRLRPRAARSWCTSRAAASGRPVGPVSSPPARTSCASWMPTAPSIRGSSRRSPIRSFGVTPISCWRPAGPPRRVAGATPALANRVLAFELRRRLDLPLHDLGPMRAARRDDLLALGIEDRRSGWPLEMVVLAARAGWRIDETTVAYAPRLGRSKVTGTVRGTARAVADMDRVLRRHTSVRAAAPGEGRAVTGQAGRAATISRPEASPSPVAPRRTAVAWSLVAVTVALAGTAAWGAALQRGGTDLTLFAAPFFADWGPRPSWGARPSSSSSRSRSRRRAEGGPGAAVATAAGRGLDHHRRLERRAVRQHRLGRPHPVGALPLRLRRRPPGGAPGRARTVRQHVRGSPRRRAHPREEPSAGHGRAPPRPRRSSDCAAAAGPPRRSSP